MHIDVQALLLIANYFMFFLCIIVKDASPPFAVEARNKKRTQYGLDTWITMAHCEEPICKQLNLVNPILSYRWVFIRCVFTSTIFQLVWKLVVLEGKTGPLAVYRCWKVKNFYGQTVWEKVENIFGPFFIYQNILFYVMFFFLNLPATAVSLPCQRSVRILVKRNLYFPVSLQIIECWGLQSRLSIN